MHVREYSFDIVAETTSSEGGAVTDLYCINLDSWKTPYYCQFSNRTLLKIRERNESGRILGTANICHETGGITILELNDKTLHLKHGHHSLPHYHSITTFNCNGMDYCWEGHSELYRKGRAGNVLIATFYPSGVVGTVEVVLDGEEMSEVVLITCMILLKRVELQTDTMNSS